MKQLFFCSLFIIVTIISFGKNNNILNIQKDSINILDANGKRQGYWIENKNGLKIEMYYINDTLNGLYKTYYQNMELSSFGSYYKGETTGEWYFFDEKGYLMFKQENIKKINYSIKNGQETVKYHYSSVIKFYFPNGKLKEKGSAFYNDVEQDILKSGTWTSYDEKGHVSLEKYNKNGEKIK